MDDEKSDATMPDLESVYDEQIGPLMAQIISICKAHKMPVLASFRYSDDGHCTTALIGGEFPESAKLSQAYRALMVERDHVTFAETHTTGRDGRTTISIRRVT